MVYSYRFVTEGVSADESVCVVGQRLTSLAMTSAVWILNWFDTGMCVSVFFCVPAGLSAPGPSHDLLPLQPQAVLALVGLHSGPWPGLCHVGDQSYSAAQICCQRW